MSSRAKLGVAGAALIVAAIPATVVAGSLGGSDRPGQGPLAGVATARLHPVGAGTAGVRVVRAKGSGSRGVSLAYLARWAAYLCLYVVLRAVIAPNETVLLWRALERMLIVDRRIAVIPAQPPGPEPGGSVVITQPEGEFEFKRAEAAANSDPLIAVDELIGSTVQNSRAVLRSVARPANPAPSHVIGDLCTASSFR